MRNQTRTKFLLAGLSMAAATLWKCQSKPAPSSTMRFLSRDGKLVEVDMTKLSAARRPASKEEVQGWVNKK